MLIPLSESKIISLRVKISKGYNLICTSSGQVARLEAKSAAADTAEEARRQYASVLIRANEMVESIKQAIVLLQIAKNAAAPDEPGAVKEFNGAIDALTKSSRGEVRILIEHSTYLLILIRLSLMTPPSKMPVLINHLKKNLYPSFSLARCQCLLN